ncbi:MAG: cytochrome c oxidase accessory protein CcoG [Burkholderiaceae bacterium]
MDAPASHAYPTIPLRPITTDADADQEQALFEVRRKIYPRAVHGVFARWRIAMVILTQLVFYGLPWLSWNGRQAVLFDLGARKFHIFGLVLWPQDFIYLTALLIISALSLFLFTAVAGRLWCGYACPQTVYTEMFMWIERKIEGDRTRRMQLDKAPWTARKFALKGAKQAAWIAVAAFTGFTFVGYFTPIVTLAHEVATATLGPWEGFWIVFYGAATYGNAGYMREQVCKYMCPYARFQSVMFDSDTLTVTYDMKRGEPRGSRSRKVDRRAAGLGDCVDCSICVQVCPVGIDIREGLQYECIGCAACIDSCDQVMDKMGYPRGLIRYTTENALLGKTPEAATGFGKVTARLLRPRIVIYTMILGSVATALATSLYLRTPLKVNVLRDRATLVRDAGDGRIENVYRLQITNAVERPRSYSIAARGLDGLKGLEVVLESDGHGSPSTAADVDAASTRMVPLRVRADPAGLPAGSHPITFVVTATDDPAVSTSEKSIFFSR